MDTWILLREMEILLRDASGDAPERQRAIHLLKSRGMAHSRKMEPFEITDQGIHMLSLRGDSQSGNARSAARAAGRRAK
jgi:circadian clock protein KaiC